MKGFNHVQFLRGFLDRGLLAVVMVSLSFRRPGGWHARNRVSVTLAMTARAILYRGSRAFHKRLLRAKHHGFDLLHKAPQNHAVQAAVHGREACRP